VEPTPVDAPASVVPPPPPPPNPLRALARGAAARRGLGTRRGLRDRILDTRQLLRAWQRAGKYLSKPGRKMTGPLADAELTRLLVEVFELLGSFPPFLGHPGQPGYRVAALAEQEAAADLFRRLDADHRALLARDWADGRTLLLEHLRFLREETRALRCGACRRALRAVHWWVHDHPVWVSLALAAVVALAVAVTCLRR
jgi:hypothetical protein